MKIQRHWIPCFILGGSGAVLYRALDSGWLTVENQWLYYGLTVLFLTMALAGIVLFIFLANANAAAKAKASEKPQ